MSKWGDDDSEIDFNKIDFNVKEPQPIGQHWILVKSRRRAPLKKVTFKLPPPDPPDWIPLPTVRPSRGKSSVG